MSLNQLENYLCDELNDAEDYAKKALWLKKISKADSDKFLAMSKEELAHAKNFFEMIQNPDEHIVSYYSKRVAEITIMQSL